MKVGQLLRITESCKNKNLEKDEIVQIYWVHTNGSVEVRKIEPFHTYRLTHLEWEPLVGDKI